MDNKKIVELLKVLKKIYVCEMAGFNESFDLVQDANMDDLNAFLEENGVNTLDVIESCYNVKNVMEDRFAEDDYYEKSPEGVKEFFYNYECIKLSDKEANGIYEKYLKNK
jgi:hypothetical protein